MASWEDGLDKHLLARVNAILASGRFIEPLKEAAADEEVLGEMSAVERALFTIAKQLYKEILQKLGGVPMFSLMQWTTICTEDQSKWTVMKTLFALIYDRLGIEPYTEKLGLRQGFKIVRSRVQKPQPGGKS